MIFVSSHINHINGQFQMQLECDGEFSEPFSDMQVSAGVLMFDFQKGHTAKLEQLWLTLITVDSLRHTTFLGS